MLIKGDGKQVVYKTRREILGVKCDICNGEMRFSDISKVIKYFEVATSHRDWGNDSYESLHHYSICPGCVTRFVTGYLAKDCSDSNTAAIDIETSTIHKGQLEWD